MFVLFSFLISIVISIIESPFDTEILTNIYTIAVLLPSIGLSIRRLHDSGRSGWWVLIPCVLVLPIAWYVVAQLYFTQPTILISAVFAGISIIAVTLYIIYLYCIPSQPGTNQYGPNPKGVTVPAPTPSAPVVEKAPEAPLAQEDEVVINDISVAEPVVYPEEKV